MHGLFCDLLLGLSRLSFALYIKHALRDQASQTQTVAANPLQPLLHST